MLPEGLTAAFLVPSSKSGPSSALSADSELPAPDARAPFPGGRRSCAVATTTRHCLLVREPFLRPVPHPPVTHQLPGLQAGTSS